MKQFSLSSALLFVALIVQQSDAQTVTVTLTDHTGNTVVPILDEPVPGLTAYAGRHSFDARTGGANADQETREPLYREVADIIIETHQRNVPSMARFVTKRICEYRDGHEVGSA